jgi:hypothetical protein
VNNLRSLMSATLIALAFAAPSVRAADESPWKFEFHGFVTASMYYQDQIFNNGQGQGLLYSAQSPGQAAPCVVTPATPCTAAGSATKSGSIMSGDLRNSRFAFSMAGPKVFDGAAQPRAYLEFDFFGLNAAGGYGTEQPVPRLRVGYAELKIGNGNLQVGQQNQLVVVQIPASLSHIANPVTYGAGTIGWRTPGIRYTHLIPIDSIKLELAAEAVKNKWVNEVALGTAPPTNWTTNLIGYGESSGMPMFQARAKVDGKAGDFSYMAYLVGVYGKFDMNGFGDGYALPAWTTKTTVDQNVFEVGGKVTFAPVSLSGNFYTGKNTANMLGSQLVFGDISDTGYWVQLAGNITKELSLSVAYGADSPDEADIRRVAAGGNAGVPASFTPRLENTLVGGMIKYQDGGYALGVEYWANKTTWCTNTALAAPTTSVKTDAMQVIATAAYFF